MEWGNKLKRGQFQKNERSKGNAKRAHAGGFRKKGLKKRKWSGVGSKRLKIAKALRGLWKAERGGLG